MQKNRTNNSNRSFSKSKAALLMAALTGISMLAVQPAFAQGSLTPPGAPTPTMKSLDQIEARTPISSLPFTISNSGSYYLTASLTGTAGNSGITTASGVNDVTVDLNGFSLIGVATSVSGFNTQGSRIMVKNGILRNWGANGINAAAGQNNEFKNLIAANNGVTGIDAGSRSLVESCEAETNGTHGIAVGGGSIVRNCLANRNANTGINCYNTGSIPNSAVVTGCSAAQNSIGISISLNSFISENNLLNNSFAGVSITGNGSRVENNNLDFNYNGVNTPGATNVIIRNTFTGNTNAAVLGITAGMPVGPLINAAAMGTNSNPAANYTY